MISKNQIKFIKSLELKKYRKVHQAFVAEGPKIIRDIFPHFTCKLLAATQEWFDANQSLCEQYGKGAERILVSEEELQKISFLKTPQDVLAVFQIPDYPMNLPRSASQELCLGLDGVQDPGNLGTIVRLADWFGIEEIFCSQDTADIYNPKTVQATMGAIARVRIHYLPLAEALKATSGEFPVYGTLLEGKNLYRQELENRGIIVMGNEGKGLSEAIRQLVTHQLYIPSFPASRETSESLNVAIATAVVCAEFRRRESNQNESH